MKHQGYLTRALKARDQRFTRIFERMGYDTTQLRAADEAADGETDGDDNDASAELTALRQEYQTKLGKRAYHAWSADELREKIAAAEPGGS